MISGKVLGGEALESVLNETAKAFGASLEQSIGRLTLKLVASTKLKLSDDVLRVKTGRLRRSINSRVERSGDKTVGYVGTNVVYAKRHEFGFVGEEPVKAHMRKIKQAWGRSIKPREVSVSAHSRHINAPERSFLRSALAEMNDDIHAAIAGAVTDVVKP